MTLGEVEEPLGCPGFCWLRCYKTVCQTKRGETHIHQQLGKPRGYTVVFGGGWDSPRVFFQSFESFVLRVWEWIMELRWLTGVCNLHMFQSCLWEVLPHSVPTPLQINSQKGELSIRKMEVQVENFDTQLSMSFKIMKGYSPEIYQFAPQK